VTPALSFAVTAVLLFAGVSVALSAALASLRRPILGRLRSTGIRSAWIRADLAWLSGVMPPLVALFLILCAASPSVPALAGLDGDHCHDHGGHGHFCPTHAPPPPVGLTLLAAVLVGGTVWRAAGLAKAEWRAAQRVRALSRLGRAHRVRGVEEVWVPGSPRLCHATGWWRPRVLVSESLAQRVGAGELRAAIAHEHAHHRRRDPLAMMLLRIAGTFQPTALARKVESDFRIAAELASDAAAAHAVGDSLLVASALLEITRVSIAAPGLAMGRDAVEQRVQALLDEPGGEVGRAVALPLAGACLLLLTFASKASVGETHHVLGLHRSVEGLLERAMETLGHP
jgi:Zn-dependent protease with chaperone function